MALEEGHQVAAVFAPGPRDRKPDRLSEAARAAGVRAHAHLRPELVPPGTGLIVCAHAHDFVSAEARARARLGAIGYHPSLLPLHRGKDAIRWAIRMREPVTGGTVYRLSDGVDAGPVIAQEFCFIRPGDTAAALWRRDLFPMGVRLLRSALQALERGEAVLTPQDETIATWEPCFDRESLASAALRVGQGA